MGFSGYSYPYSSHHDFGHYPAPSHHNDVAAMMEQIRSEEREKYVKAIKDYIDEFYIADLDGERISWPSELARMIGWTPPSDDDVE